MEQSSFTQTESQEGGNDHSNISLRPLDLSDIDDFMVWMSEEQDGLDYMRTGVLTHPWYRAICLNNRPIGAICVKQNWGDEICRVVLVYVLGSKYWGKGIATKAVQMVAKTIFSEMPKLERLEALVEVENAGSQKVLQKVGFMREGVLRKYFIHKGRSIDMVVFSLLSTDPVVDCILY